MILLQFCTESTYPSGPLALKKSTSKMDLTVPASWTLEIIVTVNVS